MAYYVGNGFIRNQKLIVGFWYVVSVQTCSIVKKVGNCHYVRKVHIDLLPYIVLTMETWNYIHIDSLFHFKQPHCQKHVRTLLLYHSQQNPPNSVYL